MVSCMFIRSYGVFAMVAGALFPALTHATDDVPGVIDSVVIGAFAHTLQEDQEDGVDANLELRFRPVFGADWAIEFLPTIGGTLNTSGDTNTAYLGATARYHLTESLFLEGFFGFALHDADTPRDADGLDLGCNLLFREGAGLGYRKEKHAISLYISHVSHGDILCDEEANDGMTSIGMRYAYHF